MKWIAALFAFAQLAMVGTPAMAQADLGAYGSVRTVETISWIEEWDEAQGRWVRVTPKEAVETSHAIPTITTTIVDGRVVSQTREAARFARPSMSPNAAPMLARYDGPFKPWFLRRNEVMVDVVPPVAPDSDAR